MSSHRFTSARLALEYMLAGNSRVTLVSRKTGARFTFKIQRPRESTPWFVSILNGPDNGSDYQFLGTIFLTSPPNYMHGRRSRIDSQAPSAKAFMWAFGELISGHLPTTLEVWHEGTCGRCARALTVPSSIAAGLGPECAKR